MWIIDLVGYHYGRTKGTKRIEALPADPLFIGVLKIACRDVVANGVASDVVECLVGDNMSHLLPDHDGEFTLIVNRDCQLRVPLDG